MTWSVGEAAVLAVVCLAGLLVLSPGLRRAVARLGQVLQRIVRRSGFEPVPAPEPVGRPIEVIAQEARRLGRRYRATRAGVSFAKSEGVRLAYDGVLAEGCTALGLSHLLGVLPPGTELDDERIRVERLLHVWGLDLDEAA